MNPKLIAILIVITGAIATFAQDKVWWKHDAQTLRESRHLPPLPGFDLNLAKVAFDYADGGEKYRGATNVRAAEIFDDRFYYALFPGAIAHPVAIQVVDAPGGMKDGAIGNTYVAPQARGNYQAIGHHSQAIGNVSIEVYNQNDVDTMVHELSHSYNASLRGTVGGYHFFDEGMAVFTNWMYNHGKMEEEAIALRPVLDQCPDAKAFKMYCYSKFKEIPPGEDYPLAGFFMTQVYDLCGVHALKYLITVDQKTEGPDKVYYQLMLEAGTSRFWFTEEQFWNEMYSRLKEWTK